MKKLSILMPVFNEEKTVQEIIERVLAVKLPIDKEIIIVNDGSKDKTAAEVKKILPNKFIKYFEHEKNLGKGAAVGTAISKATGDYLIIQDADLEYDPNDISRLLEVAQKKPGTVVYGSRLTEAPVMVGENRTPLLLHYFGNKFLSLITSILYFSWITDMETCYKLFPKKATENLNLKARGFELEPEITAKFLKKGLKIIEIPISTKPRGYEEGKKLNTWKDGKRALSALLKYRFTD